MFTFVIVLRVKMHIFLFAQLSSTNCDLEQEKTSIPNSKELRPIRRRLIHLLFGAVAGLYWKMASLRCFCVHM